MTSFQVCKLSKEGTAFYMLNSFRFQDVHAGFEVFMILRIQVKVFWVVMQCSAVGRFRWPCCFHDSAFGALHNQKIGLLSENGHGSLQRGSHRFSYIITL